MDTTVAVCQPAGLGMLVTVVALFLPRVPVGVVPVHLPEPWLVVLHETEPAYPFGGLPEIEVRHQEARWAAVLGRERFAVEFPDDECLSIQQILDRKVGRIAAVAERSEER